MFAVARIDINIKHFKKLKMFKILLLVCNVTVKEIEYVGILTLRIDA